MSRLHFISHVLPREIDDFDRMLDHLHRAGHFLQEGDDGSSGTGKQPGG